MKVLNVVKLCPLTKNEDLSLKIKKKIGKYNGGRRGSGGPVHNQKQGKINLRLNLTRNEDTPEFHRILKNKK